MPVSVVVMLPRPSDRCPGASAAPSPRRIEGKWYEDDFENLRSDPAELHNLINDLESLQLIGAPITDFGLACLQGLTGLNVLNLINTPVTDAGLRHLTEISGLKLLSVSNARITDAGLQELRMVLPECLVGGLRTQITGSVERTSGNSEIVKISENSAASVCILAVFCHSYVTGLNFAIYNVLPRRCTIPPGSEGVREETVMKLAQLLLSGFAGLAMSLAVTAGSVYVTVSAPAAGSAVTAVHQQTPVAAEVDSATTPAVADPVQPPAGDVTTPFDAQLTEHGTLTARFSGLLAPSGELQPASGLNVTLVAATGEVFSATTDLAGVCQFDGLSAGLYTISAVGPQGRLSYGIRAVAGRGPLAQRRSGSPQQPASLGGPVVELDAVLTPARDSQEIERVVSSVDVVPVDGTSAGSSGSAAIQTQYSAADEYDDSPRPAHEPLRLSADGSLAGQVTLLSPTTGGLAAVNDLHVRFIEDDTVVATTTVNHDGSFVQRNLPPGIYSMVVAGRDGIGYTGIEVVDVAGELNQSGAVIPTALQNGDAAGIGIVQGAGAAGGGDGDGGPGGEEPGSEEEEGAPFAGQGGGAGGGTGAGGGVGGGEGLGDLLGLAALGLGAAALADDDNNIASPAF